MGESTPSRESIAELLRMRADADRYRFWRRIFLRRPDRQPSGRPLYSTSLETAADIGVDEFDRILDAARADDDGAKTTFATGFLAEIPVAAPVPKSGALPPVVCQCGVVRPPTRGRRPAEWSCISCLAASGVPA